VPRVGAVYETSEEGSGVAYGNRWWVIEQARGAPTMGETSGSYHFYDKTQATACTTFL
jgi:hypothetical protein